MVSTNEASLVMDLIAVVGLFLGICVTFATAAQIHYKQKVSTGNVIVLSIGWTMFISAMWIL